MATRILLDDLYSPPVFTVIYIVPPQLSRWYINIYYSFWRATFFLLIYFFDDICIHSFLFFGFSI